MQTTISLAAWKEYQEDRIREFELYWKSQMQSEPQDFPAELEKGDWDEQFAFYQEEI